MSKAKSKQKVVEPVSDEEDDGCDEDHDVEKGLTSESKEGMPSAEDFLASLPPIVRKRVKALKKLQFSSFETESKFYEEVHLLECKFAERYAALFEKREKIVNGKVEPTDEECDWPSDDEDEEEEGAESKPKAIADAPKGEGDDEKKAEEEKLVGIPEFWLTILKNVEMLSEMIEDHDEKILTHLRDIHVTFASVEPYGFTLHFVFEANEYFSNTVLTKHYTLRMAPNPEDPLGYEGPEITGCKGCSIDWKPGKNVTVKTVKKVQKHKGRAERRTVTQTVPRDSFFNFFSPPTVKEGEEVDDETEQALSRDYEIGHFIRERIVPRAVLYFTGDALDDEFGDDDYEEGDEDDDEYDEDADPDYKPKEGEKPDCKQQ